ncbi:MAG: DUF6722 family protein [Bacteroidota bacterium]
MKKELGKYLLDISKIIFATAFLGTILAQKETNKFMIIVASLIFVITLAILGLYLLNKNKKEE